MLISQMQGRHFSGLSRAAWMLCRELWGCIFCVSLPQTLVLWKSSKCLRCYANPSISVWSSLVPHYRAYSNLVNGQSNTCIHKESHVCHCTLNLLRREGIYKDVFKNIGVVDELQVLSTALKGQHSLFSSVMPVVHHFYTR